MATEILLPKLGLTMEEGVVDEWLVDDGAQITVGMPLLRLATDKIDVDVEAEGDGILHRAVANGATLEPGAVLGWLLAPGEEPPPTTNPAGGAPVADAMVAEPAVAESVPVHTGNVPSESTGRRFISPNARRIASELGVDPTTLTGTGPGGRVVSEDVEQAALTTVPRPTSPLARRDAARAGLDLTTVSDASGYVSRESVRAAISSADAQSPAVDIAEYQSPREAAISDDQRVSGVIPLRGMRGTIAQRMVSSLQEMAQLTHGFEVSMDAVVAVRGDLKEQYAGTDMAVPSLNDFVVKAASIALRQHPGLNASIIGDEIRLWERIHVGMAVSVPNGLMVPVIRDADRLPLSHLAEESRSLAQRCRDGSITLDDLEGGTFAVTSLGTYGVDFFTPVINPGNVAILGVGRLRDSVAWEGEVPRRTQVLTLSLTFDHRAVDGAPAAEYLLTVAEVLTRPLLLLG
jgi:pyruvate/2-oxoglutarate dehydrogenase complex dihydrolipoamide acyltransferase (E2) component